MRTFPIFLAMTALSAAACGAPAAAPVPPPPATVRAVSVNAAAAAPLVARGVAAPAARLRLGFKVPGVIAAVTVREGERVRRGQVLARLDTIDVLAHRRAALAAREKARRDSQVADRLVAAGASGSLTREDARSQVELAEANVALAEEAVRRSQLVAPTSGVVFQRVAEPGETVGPGTPVVVVDEAERLVVKIGVSERDLPRLRPGQESALSIDASGEKLAGTIASIAATPNLADGLYEVQITPRAAPALRSGALVTARFEAEGSAPVLRIPLEALVHRHDKDWVFVVADTKGEPAVKLASVALGRSEGRDVVVTSGLRGGETVVAEGAFFLEDGQKVHILEAEGAKD